MNIKIFDKIFTEIPKNKYFRLLPDFKNKRTQKFTTIIFTFIALSFLGLFALNPTFSTITKLKKELKDDKFVEQQLKLKIVSLTSLQQQYSLIEKDISIVLNAIPQKSDIPLLFGQIQALAQRNNITIINLQNFQVELFKHENLNKEYYSYFFSLSGRGNPEDVINFITSVTNMERVINIENLSINSSEDLNGPSQFNLRGIAYYKM